MTSLQRHSTNSTPIIRATLKQPSLSSDWTAEQIASLQKHKLDLDDQYAAKEAKLRSKTAASIRGHRNRINLKAQKVIHTRVEEQVKQAAGDLELRASQLIADLHLEALNLAKEVASQILGTRVETDPDWLANKLKTILLSIGRHKINTITISNDNAESPDYIDRIRTILGNITVKSSSELQSGQAIIELQHGGIILDCHKELNDIFNDLTVKLKLQV